MTNDLNKNILIQLKGLGIYEIVGGVIGIGLTIYLIATQLSVPGLLFLIFLFSLLLYCYSIYCGIVLLKNKSNALNYSLVNQYLQLINFSILGYAFQYISGIYLSVGIDLTSSEYLKINFGVSAWQININRDKDIILVNLNFVALFLIIFIDNLKKKINISADVVSSTPIQSCKN